MGKLCTDEEILRISDVIQRETLDVMAEWNSSDKDLDDPKYQEKIDELRFIAEELKKGLLFRITMDVVSGDRHKTKS